MKALGYIPFLLMISNPIFSQEGAWECKSQDASNRFWSATSQYQVTALNMAYEACKKESSAPATCIKADKLCQGGPQISRTYSRPMNPISDSGWRCMALDRGTKAWFGPLSNRVDKAAIGAMTTCKKRSKLPKTCHLNFVTCIFRD